MSWFETELRRGQDVARVRVVDRTVEVLLPERKPVRCTYPQLEDVAACVFEANVEALIGEGFHEVSNRGDESIPGALDFFFGQESWDYLYWLRWDGDMVEAAFVDGADFQAIFDGIGADLHRARRLGKFDKSKLDPVGDLVHALRRLSYHPAAASLTAFDLAIGFSHDRLLDMVGQSLGHSVTHLSISHGWRNGPLIRIRPLAHEFPKLQVLSLARWSVPWFTEAPFENLRHLNLHSYSGVNPPPPTPSLSTTLDQVESFAPVLESLQIREVSVDPDALRQLLRHSVVRRLRTLDLAAISYRPDLELLFERRHLLSHVENIFINDRVLSDDDRARLADWPAIRRVGYELDAEPYERWVASRRITA